MIGVDAVHPFGLKTGFEQGEFLYAVEEPQWDRAQGTGCWETSFSDALLLLSLIQES